MNTKPTIIIAVDPDNKKNGFAMVDLKAKTVTHSQLDFWSCVDALYYNIDVKRILNRKILAVIEAGWHNVKSSWHVNYRDTRELASRKGYCVGLNHEVGILLHRYLKENFGKDEFIEIIDATPLRKCWKGPDGKITQEELSAIVQNAGLGKLGRTNQEERDAILLAITYAELPIRL